MQEAPLTLSDYLRRFPQLYKPARYLRRKALDFGWALARKAFPRWSPWGPPKGTFSAYELVKNNRVPGRVLETKSFVPNPKLTALRTLAGLRQDTWASWPVFWAHFQDARLVGNSLGILDEKKQMCLESIFNLSDRDPAYHFLKLPPPVRLDGNWTSTISYWGTAAFYHWFLDALPRLALLPEFPEDTRVLVPPNLTPNQLDTLDWLGLRERIRPTVEKHVVAESFYFSPPFAMTGCHDPYAINFLRKAFSSRADASYDSPRKFFLVRVAKSRGIINEPEVIRFFEARGWAVLDPESLSMARQIQLFSKAESICSLHGGALTNVLWCNPGCKVYELVASTFMNGVFEGLSELVGVDYKFMICPGDAAFRAQVDVRRLEEWIAD